MLFCLPFILLILTSTITRGFGPYKGKVVDLETKLPIEGAAVLITFHARRFDETLCSGAIDTLTDKNGEFKFSRKRLLVFHILSEWDPYGYIKIFKPGYGCYPDHNDSSPLFVPNGTIPEKDYVTFNLPRLQTIEERRQNALIFDFRRGGMDRKMKKIIQVYNEERAILGLSPIK